MSSLSLQGSVNAYLANLSRFLPYDSYSSEMRIFENNDGSLGALFEALPLKPETGLESGSIAADRVALTIDSLRSWFQLPSNCVLQVLYDQPPACAPSKQILVSLRYFPRGFEVAEELKRFDAILTKFDQHSKIPLKRLTVVDLLNFVRRFFSPKTFYGKHYKPYDPGSTLSAQLGCGNPFLSGAGIVREGLKTRVLAVKTVPQFIYPGGLPFFMSFPFPVKLSLNFRFPEVSRHLRLSFNIIVDGRSERELEERVEAVSKYFSEELACVVTQEEERGFELCLNALPFNFALKPESKNYSAATLLRVLASDAAKLMPLFSAPHSWCEDSGACVSSKNEIKSWESSDTTILGHTIVLGDSESDLRLFVDSCLGAIKKDKPQPLIFSVRSGEAKDSVVIHPERGFPLNPFAGAHSDEKSRFLTQFLTLGIELADPYFKVSEEYWELLFKAIKAASCLARKNSLPAVRIDDITSELLKAPVKAVSRELAVRLGPFTGDGAYAIFLKKTGEPVSLSSASYQFDLSRLKTFPVLEGMALLAIAWEISCIMKLEENRGRAGYFVFDDLGPLWSHSGAGRQCMLDFIDLSHSLPLKLICHAPRPENYCDSEAGRVFWKSAHDVFFLRTNECELRHLFDHHEDSPKEKKNLIASLCSKDGEYFDVLHVNRRRATDSLFRYFAPASAPKPVKTSELQEALVSSLTPEARDAWDCYWSRRTSHLRFLH